ncbi:hypothetical protein COCMIDRAFT_34752 [Bipolaris oryzae ATCC 44560]|uniref:F-box domain-containing protein n=1 Tax=Bipolaris oryzae ATCC 44560 TaxID=930090 RepID=W6ZJR1_COCMI|nr:uncharacterized protein COCMIDRAFT_34752 [Bipolaris oryzae ATCC 44560]EUC47684.1 hypothetical protein COCMIDRAFT_34752 [Bipolaris oryzae ATCC 44560]
MSPHILSLPAELLSQIITSLPLPSLLRFSETCRPARTLANANLQSLSLGIPPYPPHTHSPHQTTVHPTPDRHPHDHWLHIPNITTYPYTTLSNFQSALLTTLLTRHAPLLSHVDITLWTMSVRMAHALRNLSALQRLSLRFDAGSHGRAVERAQMALDREEQRKAWGVLGAETPSWGRRLLGLRVEGAVVGTAEVAVLLKESRGCEELCLERCSGVDGGIWDFLGSWCGKERVRRVEFGECGGVIGEGVLSIIGGMGGLEYLNVYDCQEELAPGTLERWNEEVWRIPHFVAPRPSAFGVDMVIEVDPEYVS